MDDAQATLLLTRPKPQSVQFLTECEALAGRRLPVVISPVLKIEHLEPDVDFTNYTALVITSANGVAAVGDLKGRKVITVGEKTAALARQAGAEAICLGADVESLIENAGEMTSPVLHCRGVHTRGDLAARLTAMGIKTDEAVVYNQIAQPLNQAAMSLLEGTQKVIAPVFSPRSAQLLSASNWAADICLVAMSEAVASAWTLGGAIDVASSPTSADMAELTVRQF